jgi:thiol-disulfide isomerase/thioredoxin
MNKLWLLLPLALATTPALAQSCVLTGNIAGLGNKPVSFEYKSHGVTHIDTVRAVQDHFTYTAKPSDDGMAILRIVRSPYTHLWIEPGKLMVAGSAAQPDKLTIMGTPENNAYSEYNRTVEWKYDVMAAKTPAARAAAKEQNGLATIEFIKQHPTTRTSAFLLYWQTLMHTEKPLAEYEQLFKQLTPAVRKSTQGQQLTQRLLVLRNQPTVGHVVPAFTMADTTGKPVALAMYRGKYVLLDFWGHWCGPCIESMPKLKELHAQYADKLAVVGIAMEGAEDAGLWKRAIRKYQVPGVQLSELQADEGPVMKLYNITAYPTYLLLDPQGVLVLRADDIADVIKKLPTIASLR